MKFWNAFLTATGAVCVLGGCITSLPPGDVPLNLTGTEPERNHNGASVSPDHAESMMENALLMRLSMSGEICPKVKLRTDKPLPERFHRNLSDSGLMKFSEEKASFLLKSIRTDSCWTLELLTPDGKTLLWKKSVVPVSVQKR